MTQKKTETRKHGRHLRVPVLPEEEEEIKKRAKQTGLSVAAYLRNIGLGYQVPALSIMSKSENYPGSMAILVGLVGC